MFQADLTARQSQFGNYQIVRKIASGGMAEVYEAYRVGSENFQTRVALKCIRPELTANERFLRMFINEAHLGSQLIHPNIVQIQDFNRVDDVYYLAMEYVAGTDLATFMQRVLECGEPLPRPVILDISIQAMAGMAYAHAARSADGQPMNIVHRDIKPSNFLINRQGTVKIADFGIAKASTNTYQTQTQDHIKGTLKYMSPEQVDGAALGPATDLFSFAVILYELITTKELFDAPGIAATLIKIATANIADDLAAFDDHWPQMAEVLRKSLHRDPAQRFSSAVECGKTLRTLDTPMAIEGALERYLRRRPELFDPTRTNHPETLNMRRDAMDGEKRDGPLTPTSGGDPLAVAGTDPAVKRPSPPSEGDFDDVSEAATIAPIPGGGSPPPVVESPAHTAMMDAVDAAEIARQGRGDGADASPTPEEHPNEAGPPSDSDLASRPTTNIAQAATPEFDSDDDSGEFEFDEGFGEDDDHEDDEENTPAEGMIVSPSDASAIEVGAPPPTHEHSSPQVSSAQAQEPPAEQTPPPISGNGVESLWGDSVGQLPPQPDPTTDAADEPTEKKRPIWPMAVALLALIALGAWWAMRPPPPLSKPAFVTVTTTPPGAKILIDGKYIGELSPARVQLPVERRQVTLSIEAKSFVPVSETLTYGEGSQLERGFNLQLAEQKPGWIELASDPPGAHIILNDKDVSRTTPASLKGLPAGVHVVELKLDGYESTRIDDLSVEAGTETKRTVVLTPLPTPTPKKAKTVAKRPRRPRKPVQNPPLKAPEVKAQTVKVTFNTFPADATLTLDGSLRQVSLPVDLELPEGSHSASFSYKGETVSTQFEVRAGRDNKVVYNFKQSRWHSR